MTRSTRARDRPPSSSDQRVGPQISDTVRAWGRRRDVVLVATLCATLIGSVVVGPDANWDFLNYHYYNSRALLTGALLGDVAPAGIQTYLHPLADMPIHLFVELFGTWWGMVFWAGLLQWVCLVPVWRLTGAIRPVNASLLRRTAAFAVAVTGSGAASLLYTTFGDWVIAALLCESLTRLLRAIDAEGPRTMAFATAGAFTGLAVAVKMTSATFAVAIAAGLVITAGLRAVAALTAGALASFAVIAGPWMLYLLVRFDSPLFPFYNGIFRSASGPPGNFDDARYGARSMTDIVRFPTDMLDGGIRYSELTLQDWRFAVLLLVVAGFAATHPRGVRDRWRADAQVRFLVAFLVLGYLMWITMFGIYRYFIPAEIVVSLVLVAVVAHALGRDRRLVFAVLLAVLLAVPLQDLPDWGRGEGLANPELDAILQASPDPPRYVLFAGGPPFGYVTASFPSSTRFASLAGFLSGELVHAGPLEVQLDAFIRRARAADSLAVVLEQDRASVPPPLESLGLVDCRPFTAFGRPLQMCNVPFQSPT